MMSASNIPKYLYVSFSPSLLIFPSFGSFLLPVMCRFPLLIVSVVLFSMPNSIPLFWVYILSFCIKVFSSFSFLANTLMSSMYIRWLIFSSDLLCFYPRMWLSGIIAIINSNGDSTSSMNIPHWIIASAKFFLQLSILLSRFSWFSLESFSYQRSLTVSRWKFEW